jgi:hypothetical protein
MIEGTPLDAELAQRRAEVISLYLIERDRESLPLPPDHSTNRLKIAGLGRTSRKCVSLSTRVLLARAASLQGDGGGSRSPITEKPRLNAVREALEFSALRKGALLEELDLGFYR